jgi:hypothetical protein
MPVTSNVYRITGREKLPSIYFKKRGPVFCEVCGLFFPVVDVYKRLLPVAQCRNAFHVVVDAFNSVKI